MCQSQVLGKQGQEMPSLPSRIFGLESEADKPNCNALVW